MSNEEDLKTFAISKIALPNKLKFIEEGYELIEEEPTSHLEIVKPNQIGRL